MVLVMCVYMMYKNEKEQQKLKKKNKNRKQAAVIFITKAAINTSNSMCFIKRLAKGLCRFFISLFFLSTVCLPSSFYFYFYSRIPQLNETGCRLVFIFFFFHGF